MSSAVPFWNIGPLQGFEALTARGDAGVRNYLAPTPCSKELLVPAIIAAGNFRDIIAKLGVDSRKREPETVYTLRVACNATGD